METPLVTESETPTHTSNGLDRQPPVSFEHARLPTHEDARGRSTTGLWARTRLS
jgi:hypothetical protein